MCDRHCINKDAHVFIYAEKSYYHFKNKVKNRDERIEYNIYSQNPRNLYEIPPQPSAPSFEELHKK